jgi:hypothetical protein
MGIFTIIIIVLINLSIIGEMKSLIQCKNMEYSHKMWHLFLLSLIVTFTITSFSIVAKYKISFNDYLLTVIMYVVFTVLLLVHLRDERKEIKQNLSLKKIVLLILKKIQRIWS